MVHQSSKTKFCYRQDWRDEIIARSETYDAGEHKAGSNNKVCREHIEATNVTTQGYGK